MATAIDEENIRYLLGMYLSDSTKVSIGNEGAGVGVDKSLTVERAASFIPMHTMSQAYLDKKAKADAEGRALDLVGCATRVISGGVEPEAIIFR